jgi:hypothetical protein
MAYVLDQPEGRLEKPCVAPGPRRIRNRNADRDVCSSSAVSDYESIECDPLAVKIFR